MRELKVLLLAAFITAATGLLTLFFEKAVWQIVQIILLENILILLIQVYLKQRDEDSEFSKTMTQIQDDPVLKKLCADLLAVVAESRAHSNQFFTTQLKEFLSDSCRTIASFNAGILTIDLRPGGFFFRETEAIEIATSSLWATSFVEVSPYWRDAIGVRLMSKNKKKIEEHTTVTRIFIEHSLAIDSIRDIIDANVEIGVSTKYVEADNLDSRLKRDFAIIDAGTLGVELFLNEMRQPLEVRYYSSDTEAGRREISRLTNIWRQLSYLAKEP